MGPLNPNPTELILGLICFFVIFFSFSKVLLPRIQKALEERQDAIEGGFERAEKASSDAQQVYEELRAQLRVARHEAARIRQAAAEEGATHLAAVRAEGQRQRDQLLAEARVQLEADRITAEAELRECVVAVAIELASRVVGEPLEDLPRIRAIADEYFNVIDAETAAAQA